jgi:hypothetical protein
VTAAVTPARIAIAARTLANADIAAKACREVRLPYFVACALLEQESGGHNVYGHDANGALSGFPFDVTEGNFQVFEWLVFTKHQTSNGVGPTQITYPGYFTQMAERRLDPWDPFDNMLFGFELLKGNYDRLGSWEKAGSVYNGGPKPNADALKYGRDLVAKVTAWKKRLGIK